MLLHGLEEKFDFPTSLVKIANGLGREVKTVGQEHEPSSRVRVAVAHAPELALIFRAFQGF